MPNLCHALPTGCPWISASPHRFGSLLDATQAAIAADVTNRFLQSVSGYTYSLSETCYRLIDSCCGSPLTPSDVLPALIENIVQWIRGVPWSSECSEEKDNDHAKWQGMSFFVLRLLRVARIGI